MKEILLFSLFLFGICVTQSSADDRLYKYGTLFGGWGAYSNSQIAHFGGGGGAVYESGIGFSAEAGYLLAFGNYTEGVGIVDINLNYHLLNATTPRKTVPFFGGGYTWYFPMGHLLNLGAGVDYWFKPRTGFRLELRDHPTFDSHILGVRAAFIFR